MTAEDKSPRHRVAKKPGWLARLADLGVTILIGIVIAALVRMFLLQAFWIPSGSMEETLRINDNVVATPLIPEVWDIERGDVVVFEDDLGWLPAAQPSSGIRKYLGRTLEFLGLRPAPGDQHLVKRVIGLPGDHVQCCTLDGKIEVNSKPITEPYLAPGSDNSRVPFDVTVPAGKLWVMGDNRNNSADSRAHMDSDPFVDISSVSGKVVWITWPINHWGNPSDNVPFAEVSQ